MMLLSTALSIVLAYLHAARAVETACPVTLSCSSDSNHGDADPCCTPAPGGIFIFRQRLQLDVADELGRWGIDGVQVLDCDKWRPLTTHPLSASHTHEEIASMCLKSSLFGGEEGYAEAEHEWAVGEVGEGVEEIWERAWESSGRYISTISPTCLARGDEREEGVALFFSTLHKLYAQFPASRLLAEADIIPAADTSYTLTEVQTALSQNGRQAIVSCDDDTLSAISWPLVVEGTFQSGQFQPYTGLPPLLRKTNCPSDGIKYPSSVHSPPAKPTGASWDPIYRPQPRAITKSHDDARLYRRPISAAEPGAPATVGVGGGARHDPRKLGFFKGKDQKRDENEAGLQRQFARDEL